MEQLGSQIKKPVPKKPHPPRRAAVEASSPAAAAAAQESPGPAQPALSARRSADDAAVEQSSRRVVSNRTLPAATAKTLAADHRRLATARPAFSSAVVDTSHRLGAAFDAGALHCSALRYRAMLTAARARVHA